MAKSNIIDGGQPEHQKARKSDSHDLKNHRGKESFWDEVDRCMSRNSIEYPEEQARHVSRWIEDSWHEMQLAASSLSDSSSDSWPTDSNHGTSANLKGNVIGIRGFSSGSKKGRPTSKRVKYNQVKLRLNKLQAEQVRFKNLAEKGLHKLNNQLDEKDKQIEQLSRIVEQGKSNEVTCDRIKQLEARLEDSERKSESLINQLRSQWQLEKIQLEHDLDEAKRRAVSLQSNKVPNDQTVLFLRRENERLKSDLTCHTNELINLRQEYKLLDNRLKTLISDGSQVNENHADQMAKLRLQVTRLQVYQPKLENIIETERSIKNELQKRLKQLESSLSSTKEELEICQSELKSEQTRGKHLESISLERLKAEVLLWQDKFAKLQREVSQRDAQLKFTQNKLEEAQIKRNAELERIQNRYDRDKDDFVSQFHSVKIDLEKTLVELRQVRKERDDLRHENENFIQKLHDCNRELELSRGLAERNGIIIDKLQGSANRVTQLDEQIRESELCCRKVKSDCETKKLELESVSRELGQVKQRLILQQRAHDEFRDRKEKELARMRVSLNFEQYHRQIALENIEKELKSTVRELEVMKCRFGRAPSSEFSQVNGRGTDKQPKGYQEPDRTKNQEQADN